MQFTQEQFDRFAPRAKHRETLFRALAERMPEYQINTKRRLCHLLAQLAHESGGFYHLVELWGPTPTQQKYEGRRDLGNNQKGDGFRFRGRGYIQITGRANYTTYGRRLDLDLVNDPELAAQPETAVRIACEYWKAHGLNALADADDLVGITRKINGGTNGLTDRREQLKRARAVFLED